MTENASYTTFGTRLGVVALAWNARGICGLRLPARSEMAAEAALLKRLPGAGRAEPPTEISATIAAIIRYFEGEAIDFSGVAVDLGRQDPFFANVYGAARKLRWGETTTYGAIAKALGAEPQAARDVGQAMAGNPVPLIVPCHRVLAAGGRIGGFSAPGGAVTKTRMLAMEGVAPAPAARVHKHDGPAGQARLPFEGEPRRADAKPAREQP